MPRESRKRKHPESEEESEHEIDDSRNSDTEDEYGGETGEEEENEELDSDEEEDRRRRKKSKKSKKSKKKKRKKHKHQKRSRRRSRSVEEAEDTDREGGSTPDITEEGEIQDETEIEVKSKSREVEEDVRRERRRERSRSGERRSRRARSGSRERRSYRESPKERSRSKERSGRRGRSSHQEVVEVEKMEVEPQEESGPAGKSSGGVISLSVEETNKLRESLGLPPLKMNDDSNNKEAEDVKAEKEAIAKKEGGSLIPNSNKYEVHKPAKNMAEKTEADKIRERIKMRRIKREQEAKLLTLKKLGDSDDEGDAANSWVERQKKIQKEKQEAAKRAKMLEELDDEFGVGSLVDEEVKKEKERQYRSSDLRGLKVEHGAERFQEGKAVILTLKDADILDEDGQDTLVNVNIMDDEKLEKRKEEIKKAKVGYNAYDMEEIDELTGEIKKKSMLDKYDEEIDGEKKSSFTIGRDGEYLEDVEKQKKKIKAKLQMKAKTLESLELPQMKVVSDYYTAEEQAKFKKPKKKKKVKKKILKADDLLDNATTSFGSRSKKEKEDDQPVMQIRGSLPMDIDEEDEGTLDIKPDLSNIKAEVEDEEDDLDLAIALQKARRLKQKSNRQKDVADLIKEEVEKNPTIKQEQSELTGSEFISTFDDDTAIKGNKQIILNETAEFCRNLGARQVSYETASKSKPHTQDEVDDDLREFEESLSRGKAKEERRRGKWEVVEDEDEDEHMNYYKSRNDSSSDDEGKEGSSRTILEEEPNLQQGVAAAIKLADSKGYWQKDEARKVGSSLKHLEAKNYAIDDKMRDRDDDRSSRGRDRYNGPSQPFQEKSGYTPNIKLEYIDDSGRLLNAKEAFRYLSHRFHGKGSGKMKTEKRMKKIMEESLMKNMSSTDTPLNTLEKLKKKQEEGQTPYLVLTGNKINPQDLKK